MTNERKQLSGEAQKKVAVILSVRAADKVYKNSGMALECGDGGIVAVVYEKEGPLHE